jgi:hypothetical protein
MGLTNKFDRVTSLERAQAEKTNDVVIFRLQTNHFQQIGYKGGSGGRGGEVGFSVPG